MLDEPGGEARGRSALPALCVTLGKSETCSANRLLKAKGPICLEAVGVGVMCSLSLCLEKHLLIERSWRGAADKDITGTILPISATAACQEGFSCSPRL